MEFEMSKFKPKVKMFLKTKDQVVFKCSEVAVLWTNPSETAELKLTVDNSMIPSKNRFKQLSSQLTAPLRTQTFSKTIHILSKVVNEQILLV
jgi:hypothetical protein